MIVILDNGCSCEDHGIVFIDSCGFSAEDVLAVFSTDSYVGDYPFVLGTAEAVNWYNEESTQQSIYNYVTFTIYNYVTFNAFIHNGRIRKKTVQTVSREFLIALVSFWKNIDDDRKDQALKASKLLETWLDENPEYKGPVTK